MQTLLAFLKHVVKKFTKVLLSLSIAVHICGLAKKKRALENNWTIFLKHVS